MPLHLRNVDTKTPLARRRPVMVAYGMGVDSTAMLIGLHKLGIRPDAILFADTGGEKSATYGYHKVISAWLKKVSFPPIQTVRYTVGHGGYKTLEQECLSGKTLVSLAFGHKKCSNKWKIEAQNRWTNKWPPALATWARGQKVIKMIGYDAGPADTKRAWNLTDDEQYHYVYPLREWGWDRERCIEEIRRAGLPPPPKSACFFCPANKPEEIEALPRSAQDRIMEIERQAAPYLQCKACKPTQEGPGQPRKHYAHEHTKAGKCTKCSCKRFVPSTYGLWRSPVKGERGGAAHPGDMTAYILARRAGASIEEAQHAPSTPPKLGPVAAGERRPERGQRRSLPIIQGGRRPEPEVEEREPPPRPRAPRTAPRAAAPRAKASASPARKRELTPWEAALLVVEDD
jgi:hypothetical protein